MATGAIRFQSITTQTKKAFLRRAYNKAVALSVSFISQIEQESDFSLDLVTGAVVKAASSNGHSVMSHDPGEGAPAQAEFATMWEDLIALYYRAKSFLIDPPTVSINGIIFTPIPNPTDDQIYVLMMKWLVPIKETQNDYTWGRLIPGFDYVQ